MTTINLTELAREIKFLRSLGYTYQEIDTKLELAEKLLEGCTYRDVAYRVTKMAAYKNA